MEHFSKEESSFKGLKEYKMKIDFKSMTNELQIFF